MAEKQMGDSYRLCSSLQIGEGYTLDYIASLLNRKANALSRRGVYRNTGSDCFVIFVNLKKKQDATQYQDHFFDSSSILCWEGQTTVRMAESSFASGHDCHVFIHNVTKTPYTYYGRAIPIREQINPPGTPSRFVLFLPEYAEYKKAPQNLRENLSDVFYDEYIGPTEKQNIQTIRTRQSDYRKKVLSLWNGQCAVTGVDEKEWLIASHIKPWRESTDWERIDPKNSLLLSPNYDKLFDRGVISFNPSNGKIILPEKMDARFWRNLDRLGITEEKELKFVPEGTDKYLDYHKEMVFGFTPSRDFDASDFVEQLIQEGNLSWIR